jgi:hypothetical protein
VLVHLLPEITAAHRVIDVSGAQFPFASRDSLVYVILLLGLLVFYGLEKTARYSRKRSISQHAKDVCSVYVFIVHIISYAALNAAIGYLLHERAAEHHYNLPLYAVAIGLHFFINDHWMHHNHKVRYHRIGRWILAAGTLVGWGAGVFVVLEETVIFPALAFLAGGVLMNVLKEELPYGREENYWSFAGSTLVFSAILLTVA